MELPLPILLFQTDKEAVNKALELAVIDDSIIAAHERAVGKGDLIDEVFE